MTSDIDSTEPAWMASSPAAIEDDLRQLWETAARQSPVSRALMSNLVIVAGGEASNKDAEDEAGHRLSGVARRHPARVVLLNHRCTSQAREPQSVRVGLLTFGSPEHQYGIEVISVAVACFDESLPSILRAVTRGDVPTTLWLTGDLSVATPAMPLFEISRQVVYDSGRWSDVPRGFQGVAGLLKTSYPPALVDLAWRRLLPMRRAVATALEPLRFNQRPRPAEITVSAAAGRAAEASLLWGWLDVKLGWGSPQPRSITSGGSGRLELHFQGQYGNAEVIHATVNEQDGSPGTEDVTAPIVVRDTAGRTLTVSPSQESIAEALSDELTSLSHDYTLERVIRSLAS